MLRNRYTRADLFPLVPRLGLRSEPQPELLDRPLDDRVVQRARSLKVAGGRKLRVDTTAVETAAHSPTDSGLIGDGARVVSRLLRRAEAAPGEAATGLEEASRSRVRAVRKPSRQ